ncbi:MAG: hypothetical protein HYR72_14430 [Deltaproteobacteria bacterium]|nr:hypothetical protein [Deltaproteobacteria bacterium]MBI3391540.1 hypothetical protein [Deltaproteobacteria bacterium]
MSQRTVEGLLGRLLTDGEFRRGFYENPAAICVKQSLDLTARELEAVLALDEQRVEVFAKGLDSRIVRASVNGAHYWSNWAARTTDNRARLPKIAQGDRRARRGK